MPLKYILNQKGEKLLANKILFIKKKTSKNKIIWKCNDYTKFTQKVTGDSAIKYIDYSHNKNQIQRVCQQNERNC